MEAPTERATTVFPCLEELTLNHCDKLTSAPSQFHEEASHHSVNCQLYIAKVLKLGQNLTLVSLQKLTVRFCENLETIPSSDKLTSLRSLEISRCDKLTCLPNGLAASSQSCSLTRLKELTIGCFSEELDEFPAFQAIPQLESGDGPEQIQHLPSLRHLEITWFDGVEAIPEWLGILASLEDLTIECFPSLKYLPSVEAMQRLTKLKETDISCCPLLEERCTEESGPEWPKIRHLPFIRFGRTIIEN